MLILIHYLQHSFCAQKQEQTSLFSKSLKKKQKKKNPKPSATIVVADSYYNRHLWDIFPICSKVEVEPGYLY